jgi:hypothetical protein
MSCLARDDHCIESGQRSRGRKAGTKAVAAESARIESRALSTVFYNSGNGRTAEPRTYLVIVHAPE